MTMLEKTQQDTLTYCIDLPFPISANRLWRSASTVVHTRRGTMLGAPRVHLSRQYQLWIKEADALYLSQKPRLQPLVTLGAYTLACRFSSEKRSARMDGDNLMKCVHDWLQRVEIIKNDCLCEGAKWDWGPAPHGCWAIVVGRP